VLAALEPALRAEADPERAAPMRAYQRNRFAFLGVSSKPRRAVQRAVLGSRRPPSDDDLAALARGCWDFEEREFQYAGTDWFGRFAPRGGPGLLDVARELITERSWWDTVDALASHAVGGLVAAHPRLVATMDRWILDDDLWVRRTALLHQLRYGERTDADRLFAYCERCRGERDFFIRKAIGWALRTYARTDPDAVRAFVAAQGDELSPLSRREASKHL